MAAKNRAFVSKAPAFSVRACVYERESERAHKRRGWWGGWLIISEFSKKEKGGKKNPDKAKQVEQTSVFALQMCAETTRRALQGNIKRDLGESLVKWPLHPPPAEPPSLCCCFLLSMGGWEGEGEG